MQQLSSSYREVPLNETFSHVRQFAAQLGITRVTNITRLDCIGIPVFASIRPSAMVGSLCVNAGKGASEQEAKVSAFMEAIEFAMAEFSASHLQVSRASVRDVLNGDERVEAILDFCPLIDRQIDVDLPISVIEAEELFSQSSMLVPAKLIFLPFKELEVQDSYFPSNSNGLASGNSLVEASVHALLEVIERDITSFQLFSDTSVLLLPESFPEPAASLAKAISHADLSLHVRFVPNSFNLSYFRAILFDPNYLSPLYINGGYGCHIDPSIALTRAICEAAQSRLSFIHGAREDLITTARKFALFSGQEIQEYIEEQINAAENSESTIKFEDIARSVHQVKTIPELLDFILEALWLNRMCFVCRVVFTYPSDPVQVVRIIVPKMENFHDSSKRVGPRLRDYVNSL
ncbi:MAG: hypothetical protein F6K48_23705 [Okeania sp. SIO3H1]|nr:hypothetical protein [Okeania sp. SIO3H1]